jgi:ABC-type nickel/cobalt efflux system permease component RcnA
MTFPMLAEIHASTLGSPGFLILMASTAGVAVLHTLAGPDHYLPFIVMGRARRWSVRRIVGWTTLCGVGHVASSVLVALGAVVFGYGLERVELIEEFRGNVAAWVMIAFGAAYGAWGLKRALRARRHDHVHAHAGGEVHAHGHGHEAEHAHAHGETAGFNLTPWILFTIFVLGPCEPMIPLVMYPAAQGSWVEMWLVVGAFTALTVGAMLATVLLAVRGIRLLPLQRIERYTHAVAGAVVLSAGCAIQFLGL